MVVGISSGEMDEWEVGSRVQEVEKWLYVLGKQTTSCFNAGILSRVVPMVNIVSWLNYWVFSESRKVNWKFPDLDEGSGRLAGRAGKATLKTLPNSKLRTESQETKFVGTFAPICHILEDVVKTVSDADCILKFLKCYRASMFIQDLI